MKRLLFATLLISMAAAAKESAQDTPIAVNSITAEEIGGHQTWPSLDELAKADMKEGKMTAEIRLGYEHSNVSGNGTKAANAFLTRVRVNYQTANYSGFDGFVQAQYVGPLSDTYNPRNPNYDTVADPEAFRMHQAYLGWTGYDTHARIGAQEIILDNARFIGNVGWRFNAQSFNAGLVKNQSVENLTLLYSYADSINGIDGENDDTRQYHLFNGEYKLGDHNKASAFAYLQRNENAADINTYGLRFWGKNDTLGYHAMGALQRKAYYGYLSANLDFDAVDVEVGGEYISGGTDPNERFQTLNGTAHAFNGWADQFLGTGGGLPAGLIDLWVKGSISPMEAMELIGVYHYFNTAADTPASSFSGTYGNEIDAMLKYKICDNFDALTGLALYFKGDDAASNGTNDETVFWLRGNLRF
ncbi:hypothetical protein P4B35_12875 [Pontiellaceae bacterium B12227]|nr:hypothetical protein [Pontiellaceae bacterium B12227]